MQTQYSVLDYRMDLYFHDYRLPIDVDEFGHRDRDEKQRQKAVEKYLDCEFIRIDPDEKHFNIFNAINKILNHIKHSSKKYLIDKIAKRLSELEFRSNHSIKSKCLKYVVKKYCHHYKPCKLFD